MLDYRIATFLEAYRTQSFTQAAHRLHITQPAVSQHIKHLEAHYNCTLFAKRGHAIAPTPQADALYPHMLAMANDEQRIERELEGIAGSTGTIPAGSLRLGCTRTIADYVAPGLLCSLIARHPTLDVTLAAGNTSTLLAQIEDGSLDVALVEGSFDRKVFGSAVWSHEAYVAVAAPGFGIQAVSLRNGIDSAKRPIDRPETPAAPSIHPHLMQDLLDQPLIVREHGSGTREILECSLAARNLTIADFARVYELESIPAIKACVKAGLGITFMYRIAAEQELKRGELIDITPSDFSLQHDFCLVWQRGSVMAPRYRSLLCPHPLE